MKCGQQLEQGWCRASLGGLWQAREEQHQQHARRRARQVCNVAHLHAAHPHAGAGGHHLELPQHLRQVNDRQTLSIGQVSGAMAGAARRAAHIAAGGQCGGSPSRPGRAHLMLLDSHPVAHLLHHKLPQDHKLQ